MPTPMIKKFAKEHGVSTRAAEKAWVSAKALVHKDNPKLSETDPKTSGQFFALTVGYFKKIARKFEMLESKNLRKTYFEDTEADYLDMMKKTGDAFNKATTSKEWAAKYAEYSKKAIELAHKLPVSKRRSLKDFIK
jgi:hypothetical protein